MSPQEWIDYFQFKIEIYCDVIFRYVHLTQNDVNQTKRNSVKIKRILSKFMS